MQSDQKQLNMYFKFLKDMGYKYSKHAMGFYFDRALKRFSVVQIGDIYHAYYYKREDGKYVLQEQILGRILLLHCIQWIFIRAKGN